LDRRIGTWFAAADGRAVPGLPAEFSRDQSIGSVVDAGCGDWQFSKLIDWGGIDYLGIDVSAVVLEATRRFAKKNIRFVKGDVRTFDPPPADLLIMKDVLQHWPNADISELIPKFSRFRYCLITNGHAPEDLRPVNTDVATGAWRPVDLAAAPFDVAGQYVLTYHLASVEGAGHIIEEKRVFLVEPVPG
jgi:SAM-dependent methyltransferase